MIDDLTIETHAKGILAFYETLLDHHADGRLPQAIRDDGTPLPDPTRHLVSATRYAINFCRAAVRWGGAQRFHRAKIAWASACNDHVNHDLTHVWRTDAHGLPDLAQRAYGAAFVLLMQSWAMRAGLAPEASVSAAIASLDRFREPERGLLADEIHPDGAHGAYRGQNANMHATEALMAAGLATGRRDLLARAADTARAFCLELSATTGGWVWEHYDRDWQVDLAFNRDNPRDLYRPWGYQVGHQTEWAKLLCQLSLTEVSESWMRPTARRLLLDACRAAWDGAYGGLYYGLGLDRGVCDDQKHFWVQAESFAAAQGVAALTGCVESASWADRLWHYSQRYFVIQGLGGPWHRILERDHRPTDHTLAVPGGKVDYHTFGACLDALALAAHDA